MLVFLKNSTKQYGSTFALEFTRELNSTKHYQQSWQQTNPKKSKFPELSVAKNKQADRTKPRLTEYHIFTTFHTFFP